MLWKAESTVEKISANFEVISIVSKIVLLPSQLFFYAFSQLSMILLFQVLSFLFRVPHRSWGRGIFKQISWRAPSSPLSLLFLFFFPPLFPSILICPFALRVFGFFFSFFFGYSDLFVVLFSRDEFFFMLRWSSWGKILFSIAWKTIKDFH